MKTIVKSIISRWLVTFAASMSMGAAMLYIDWEQTGHFFLMIGLLAMLLRVLFGEE